MTDNVNQCVAIKNLLNLSSQYSNTAAEDQFYYLDRNGGAAQIDPNNGAYGIGFNNRHVLLVGGASVNASIRLSNYGYFQAFKNRLHPNVKMKLKITLESDDNLMFRAGGDAGKVVVTKMKLWLPKLKFNGEGEKSYISEYLKPQVWSYLKENHFISPNSQQRSGTFKIASSIKRPRHVFVWALIGPPPFYGAWEQ